MNADNANDRCARCDCEGAPDTQALLAELRAQVELVRMERDQARDDARLLGGVLGQYTTVPRSRMAVLLWRSVRGRQAQRQRDALLRGLEAMRQDGLDIDDIATAPVWTGKVLAGERVVFDLATDAGLRARADAAQKALAVGGEAVKRYSWKWAKDATYVIFGDVFHKMNIVPPDTARRALARRWLMSGEPGLRKLLDAIRARGTKKASNG